MSMKILFTLSFFIFYSLFLHAGLTDEDIQRMYTAEEAIHSTDNVVVGDGEKKDAKRTSSFDRNKDNYYDVVVYAKIIEERNALKGQKLITSSKNEAFLADNVAKQKEALAKQQEQSLQSAEEESLVFTLSGYCSVRNEINIDSIQGYGLLDCQFEEYEGQELLIKNATVFANFVPIPDKFALLAKPIYIQHNNRKIPIKDGVLLTIDQTSLNVANFVNDRKLKRLLSDMMIQTNTMALATATSYMAQKRASETTEEISYNSSTAGNQTVSGTTTAPPEAKDYLVNFGIQFASAIIGAIGEYGRDDSYPIFKVYKNSQLYIDIIIEKKGKKQEPIDYKKEDHTTFQKNNADSGFRLNLNGIPNGGTN